MKPLLSSLTVLLAMSPAFAAAEGVHNDFDGDGRADLLWRNASTGANVIWRNGIATNPVRLSSVPDRDWQIAGTGHLHGAQFSELLWRNRVTGAMELWSVDWFMYSGPLTMHWRPVIDWSDVGGDPAQWEVSAIGDDRFTGIFLRNRVTGDNAIAYFDIYDFSPADIDVYRTNPVANLAWNVAGIGDFDGDGISDILWRNATTGQNAIWRSASYATPLGIARVANLDWKVATVGDFNGDQRADILWRNTRTGANVIWKSGSSLTLQAVTGVTNLAWKVVASGDYDGDGKWDLVWRNSSTGANVIWKSANAATQQTLPAVTNQAWKIVP
jgi:hypothetical protein